MRLPAKSNLPPYVIAEAGVNHNGSLDMALRMVDAAKQAAAHAIKFQTFKAEKLVTQSAPKANYQRSSTGDDTNQFQMLKNLELNDSAHHQLAKHCREVGIDFLSTPFDIGSLDFLVKDLGLSTIKIPSGDITNGPLLLHAASYGCNIILSTGMSTLDEIEAALKVLALGFQSAGAIPSEKALDDAYTRCHEVLRDRVCLLHCTSEYPAPLEDVNLMAMKSMEGRFGLPVGYSDHTMGIVVPIAAAALGAVVIEKHFTLDRSLPGPDHQASLTPGELSEMVAGIMAVRVSLGNGTKAPAVSELKNRIPARRSLVAACNIRAGEIFSEKNLTLKRPGGGHSGMDYWQWIGRTADRDYAADEMVD